MNLPWIAVSVLILILTIALLLITLLWHAAPRRYPPIVYRSLPRHDIGVPVFMYHGLNAKDFQDDLAYLAHNRYSTITPEELVRYLRDSSPLPERPVLITIDDGLACLWQVGFPLLKKFGFKATAFVCPGLINEGSARPTLDDVDSGKVPPSRIDQSCKIPDTCNWEEIVRLAVSGVIQIECHTMYHNRVFISPRIVDFVWSGSRSTEVDLISTQGSLGPLPIGYPVFSHGPRFAYTPRYIESSKWLDLCEKRLATFGGQIALSHSSGRKDWIQMLHEINSQLAGQGRQETLRDRENIWSEDLQKARGILAERTGQPVRHLSFPFNGSCTEARCLARSIGFASIFARSLNGKEVNHIGDDVFSINRMPAGKGGDHYVWSLPGRSRRSFAGLLANRLIKGLKKMPQDLTPRSHS